MTIYLGLGSNQGNRTGNLEKAIGMLSENGFALEKVSPVVESPALLPEKAEPEWDIPYLNVVIAGEADWTPAQGLKIAKQIEANMGRKKAAKWSPRPIDIDLLIWHELELNTVDLTIPHPQISLRSFVITPLLHLHSGLSIPGLNKTIFELSLVTKTIPLWMGILNITPDSFSDGDQWQNENQLSTRIDEMIGQGVQILDVGAESTRPHAQSIALDEEWLRLQPVIELINEKKRGSAIHPLLSVDSRNAMTIEKAINLGVNIINDVTGLTDKNIVHTVKNSGCDVVAMHSLSVPVNPSLRLPLTSHPVTQLMEWLDQKVESWLDQGLDLSRIIFDPGIGFGKYAMHSIELMSHCESLRQAGLRLLMGHSRKSFMNTFTQSDFGDRDPETLGISMALCQQGVDIIRVHDAITHIRAYRGWSHINERSQQQIK